MTGRERFGPTLRRIREQRGITLAQLADTTNVDVEMWEALERNDFSRWPTGIFARAFVREYARAIGVEPESTVDEFCRLFPQGDRRREAIIRAEAERLGLAPDWHDDLTPARDRRRPSEQASTVDVARAALLARRARLAAGGFDLGFAFDGDADRAILVDAAGAVRDGDAMLYLWARDLASRDELVPPAIVATSMSNLGLARALAAAGIELVRCDVGDRAVVESLQTRGLRLGGEQSGHLVDLRRSTTGDGLLTAIVLAELVARAGRPVGELLAGFRRYPQMLVSVRVREKPPLETLPGVARAAREVESALGADGRLVLRYSGTEPLARIMLEGPDEATIRAHVDGLAAELRAAIGA